MCTHSIFLLLSKCMQQSLKKKNEMKKKNMILNGKLKLTNEIDLSLSFNCDVHSESLQVCGTYTNTHTQRQK